MFFSCIHLYSVCSILLECNLLQINIIRLAIYAALRAIVFERCVTYFQFQFPPLSAFIHDQANINAVTSGFPFESCVREKLLSIQCEWVTTALPVSCWLRIYIIPGANRIGAEFTCNRQIYTQTLSFIHQYWSVQFVVYVRSYARWSCIKVLRRISSLSLYEHQLAPLSK